MHATYILDNPGTRLTGEVVSYVPDTLGCSLNLRQGAFTVQIRVNTPGDAIALARQIERSARLVQERRQEQARQRALNAAEVEAIVDAANIWEKPVELPAM